MSTTLSWCVPEADSDYVAHMEDVLDQYEQPYEPKRPLVCYDEGLKQLITETRKSVPGRPGPVERYDYEYQMKPSHPKRSGASSTSWNSTTRPSIAILCRWCPHQT